MFKMWEKMKEATVNKVSQGLTLVGMGEWDHFPQQVQVKLLCICQTKTASNICKGIQKRFCTQFPAMPGEKCLAPKSPSLPYYLSTLCYPYLYFGSTL